MCGDLLDINSLVQAVKGCDTVIHSAALTGVVRPELYFRVNQEGTANLVKAAEGAGCRRFVYISSMDAVHPITTDYGRSKLGGEHELQKSGMEHLIVRPTLILSDDAVGAAGHVVSFARKFGVVPLVGSGKQRCQPLLLESFAQELLQLLSSNRLGTVECGGPKAITQRELYRRILRTAGQSAIMVPVPVACFAALLIPLSLIRPEARSFYQKLKLSACDKLVT